MIVAADGRPIQSDDELIRYISAREPGAMASLDVWRDGEVRPLQVKLEERPLLPALQPRGPINANVEPASRDGALLGFSVRDREVADVRRLSDARHAVRASSSSTSIRPVRRERRRSDRGQVLLEVNRQRVTTEAEFRAVLASLRPGAAVAVLVYDPSLKERAIYSITIDPPQS